MKNSRPPIQRMIYIDQQIREKRYPNCKSVATDFEVTTKTIQRDIEYMRIQLKAPIVFDKKRNGFYYINENFFLPAVHINEKEIFALTIAEKVLNQYKNAPYFTELQNIFNRIIKYFPYSSTKKTIGDIFAFEQRPTIPIEENYLETIQNAILNSLQIHLKYHSLHKNEITERVVDPYNLMNHHGNWYFVAFCHKNNDFRTFSVGRILSLQTAQTSFEKQKDFNVQEYRKEGFDLERSSQTYQVQLKFSPYQARWIREREWHPTQKIQEIEDGSVILFLTVQGLNDLKRWVLYHGGEVEVLEPQIFRQQIQNEIKKMMRIYDEKEENIC